MADDPKPPGTHGEPRPGEDGADEDEDGAGAPDATESDQADDSPAGADDAAEEDVADERWAGAAEDADADSQWGGVPGSESPSVDGDDPPASAGDGAREAVEDGVHEADADDSADVPADVRKYQRFKKVDGAQYDRVNEFLRERTYITAREWAIARLCADFRTETGVEMTKIGEHLPQLVPFMEDTYSPQAVNQARSSFEEKVNQAGATFLYGAMCDFFTAEELDELMYEVTEVAKFLLEVEGIDLTVEEELEAEDRISNVMREVREASEALRYEECPHCGEHLTE